MMALLVEVKQTYGASILVDNRPQAYDWLRENGYDDIIKNNVICSFGRGEDDKASAFKAFAAKEGYVANQKTEIHLADVTGFCKRASGSRGSVSQWNCLARG
jgi:hypothetical protein